MYICSQKRNNMKKIIIMTLAVMVFGTVSFAKGNG